MPLDNRTGLYYVAAPTDDDPVGGTLWKGGNNPADDEDRMQRDTSPEAEEPMHFPYTSTVPNECVGPGYAELGTCTEPQPLVYKRMGSDMNYITMTEDLDEYGEPTAR